MPHLTMAWQPPTTTSRPILLLGAGVLGRRIACVFVAGGYNVHIYDLSHETRQAASDFVETHKADFASKLTNSPASNCGSFAVFDDLAAAAKDAWLVIEAIPERVETKVDAFGELDSLCPQDCIFGSNSSSFRSSLMVDKVSDERRRLVCNIHFTMPPEIKTVELMTAGQTHPEVFPFLEDILRGCGMLPATAVKESTGFIFNRLWAAIKREILQILAEGVSGPEQIDMLWGHMFRAETLPCKLMDQIGLDTVAFIEDNYIRERSLDGSNTVDWLRENYVSKGRTGQKSGNGGLYPKAPAGVNGASAVNGTSVVNGKSAANGTSAMNGHKLTRDLYALDVGLGANLKSIKDVATNGKMLRIDPSTGKATPVATGLPLPDGIDVSHKADRVFWTNMGKSTSTRDGSVMSSKLDGSDLQVLIPTGQVHTPKQLVVAHKSQKLYLCDREGTSVHRVGFDGKNHEILVDHRNKQTDMTDWCVGIAVDEAGGKIYWTQKGPSKAGKGRIFRAGIDIPAGESAESRSDVELVFGNLPEPIDLELDGDSRTLYWTDRGEHPTGSSLNRASVAGAGEKAQKEIIARHFHEPIGLKLDLADGKAYVADLGGSIYSVDLASGEKTVIHTDNGSYTGITLV